MTTCRNISRLLADHVKPRRISSFAKLRAGEWRVLLDLAGPGLITHLWMTFPPEKTPFGRGCLLRMFWDDESTPSVEAPLADFFGVPFGLSGDQFNLNSRFLTVAPVNGFNAYFEMPFARHARIEILPEQPDDDCGFYFQADYYELPDSLPAEYADLRFHAQFRFESPCENYGRNYLFMDAVGRGALVGATFGIEVNKPQADGWYHGGGDSLFVDGERDPSVIHGIGAEDFFGHSWGVEPFQSALIGTQFMEAAAPGGSEKQGLAHRIRKVALYRFFDQDPVVFTASLRGVLGALANRSSSVAYWYQNEPHTPFFKVPPAVARMPAVSDAPYGTHDIEPEQGREWRLLAPFRCTEQDPFDQERAFEARETGAEAFVFDVGGEATLPGGDKLAVAWQPQRAYHNFVDFHTVARPAVRRIALQTQVLGYALCYEERDKEEAVVFRVGFDDEILVRVNDDVVFRGTHPAGFKEVSFPVRLLPGRNRILIKLSNDDNVNWRVWAFSFRIER